MRTLTPFLLAFLLLFADLATLAQATAPGGPGQDAQWLSAGKQAIGTSANPESKVWFTLANGVLTEVMYPNVQTANVQMLQFVVVNPKTKKVEMEWDAANHQIKLLRADSLSFQQINTAKSGEWTITKIYTADPKRPSVLVNVTFTSKNKALQLYVFFDPSIGNRGMGNDGRVVLDALTSSNDLSKDGVASALRFSSPIDEATSGFSGTSDGLEQLRANGRISTPYQRAEDGNVVQMARIVRPANFTAVLSFANNYKSAIEVARASLSEGSNAVSAEYDRGWADFVKPLPKVAPKYQAQFNMAAMVIKAFEDKTVRGGNIASLSVPWGGDGNGNTGGTGYRMVWSRDLYHVFTAFLAIGDKPAAERALEFLFKKQQKPDGSFPQNSNLDGSMGWGSLQMDEVGYPLIMAWQIGRFDKDTYENHVRKAANFIVKNGPFSPQERWEERPGYSPSTIAAEIAGLVCAADIAKRNGDEASATLWLATADEWVRNIERWTATTKGKYGDGNYYIRISEKGEPDGNHKIELNNNAGTFYEHEIVDAGFLDLVRLGIKRADDPLIVKSLKVIDQLIKIETPNGPAFYRYNNDGYGEMDDGRKWNFDGKYTGKGRPWPLLSGERGQYELARHLEYIRDINTPRTCPDGKPCRPAKPSIEYLVAARSRLDHMLAFGSESLMIPEQIWDKKDAPPNADRRFMPLLKFGEGTGSATPLAWSMGQFIRLATNLKAGRNLDTPQVVYERYKNGIPGKAGGFGGLDEEAIIPLKPGSSFPVERQTAPGASVAYLIGDRTQTVTAGSDGKVKVDLVVPSEPTTITIGVRSPNGSTSFERVKILSAPPTQTFSSELVDRLRNGSSSPVVGGYGAVFFYRGNAGSVQIAGDMTGWGPGRIFMQKISDGLFAYRMPLAADARIEYKLIVDGTWRLDPLNPNKLDNGVGGENNSFAMPGYRPAEVMASPAVLDEFEISSRNFGTRKIRVYLPRSYAESTERFGAIYLQDGSDYASRAGAAGTLESLLKDKKVKPFILVFIDPRERNREYWANDAWADFVANELVPEIDRRYRTIARRDGRAVLGASLGGITSLHIGLRHPDKFAGLGGQSSSFWVDNERVVAALEKLDPAKTNFRFYLDDGTFEGADDSRRVNAMLRGKGFNVHYVEGQTGHNWTAWRDRLSEAFITLLN